MTGIANSVSIIITIIIIVIISVHFIKNAISTIGINYFMEIKERSRNQLNHHNQSSDDNGMPHHHHHHHHSESNVVPSSIDTIDTDLTTVIKEILESTSLKHSISSSVDTEQHHHHSETSDTSNCIDTNAISTSTIATDLMASIIKQALESTSLKDNISTCNRSSGRSDSSALATIVMSRVIEEALSSVSNKIPSIITNTNTTATTLITMLMKDALVSATTRIASNNATTAIATDLIMMIMKSLVPETAPTTTEHIYNDNDTTAQNDCSDLMKDTSAYDDGNDHVTSTSAHDDSKKDHVVIDVDSSNTSDTTTMNATIGTIDYTTKENPAIDYTTKDHVIIGVTDSLSSSLTFSLSAPYYLYVSTILAHEIVDTMESHIIRSYHYPCPCPPSNIVPDLQRLSTTTMTILSFGAHIPRTIQISIVNCVSLTILAILIAILNLIPVNTTSY